MNDRAAPTTADPEQVLHSHEKWATTEGVTPSSAGHHRLGRLGRLGRRRARELAATCGQVLSDGLTSDERSPQRHRFM